MAKRGAPVQPDVDDKVDARTTRLRSGNADVDAAARLLLWARRKGIRIGPVLEVGPVKMQVMDMRLLRREQLADASDGDDDEDEVDIMGEHGGPSEPPAEGTTG